MKISKAKLKPTTSDLVADLDYEAWGIHPDSWADDLNII